MRRTPITGRSSSNVSVIRHILNRLAWRQERTAGSGRPRRQFSGREIPPPLSADGRKNRLPPVNGSSHLAHTAQADNRRGTASACTPNHAATRPPATGSANVGGPARTGPDRPAGRMPAPRRSGGRRHACAAGCWPLAAASSRQRPDQLRASGSSLVNSAPDQLRVVPAGTGCRSQRSRLMPSTSASRRQVNGRKGASAVVIPEIA